MKELLEKINDQAILLELVDGKLKLFSENQEINSEILAEIKDRKEELIHFLQQSNRVESSEISQNNLQKAPIQESYPLSSSQFRLWLATQQEEVNATYDMTAVYEFNGDLDTKALEKSFHKVLDRHEIIRTVFIEDEESLVRQVVKSTDEIAFTIKSSDLRFDSEKEKSIQNFIDAEITSPFDLKNGPLLKASLIQVEEKKWVFICIMHHIISDGWSMNILINELIYFYNMQINNETIIDDPLNLQYKDFAVWQQSQLGSSLQQKQKKYWLDQFSGELPVLELIGSAPRPANRTYNGGVVRKEISSSLLDKMNTVCVQQGATLFMGLVAAVNTLLYRYTNQNDIIIGTSIAGREHPDLENQIGFYINILALRCRFAGEDSYRTLLNKVKRLTLDAYENQSFPFDEFVSELNLKRDLSRNVLFDVSVVLQNTQKNELEDIIQLKNVDAQPYQYSEKHNSINDLQFDFEENDESLKIELTFNSDIYNYEFAKQLLFHFEQLVEQFSLSPDLPIEKLDYLSKSEKQQLLEEFTGNKVAYSHNATLIELFSEQVAKTPDKTAIVYENNQMTYLELDEKANKLAHYLKTTYNLQPDELVGVLLDRSELLIVSVLAILKVGAAYVPIDTEYPNERKKYIIDDSKVKVIISDMNYIFDLENYAGGVFAMDVQLDSLEDIHEAVINSSTAANLAYVIYTSGTTGMPKGVMIENRSLVNLCLWQIKDFVLDTNTIASVFSSFSFDAFVIETFPVLLSGGTIQMIGSNIRKDENAVFEFLKEQKITHCLLPTVFAENIFTNYSEEIDSLGIRFIVAGEKLNTIPLRKSIMYNHYGPTENTVAATSYVIDKTRKEIPIGAPIFNQDIYIVDHQDNLCPLWVPGEMCISGDGLARGYLNKSELTHEKFVQNTFKPEGRMYRTGDLGRWLPDGNIEFLGRKDDQVKIRGFRIELGEVETTLLELDTITNAVAVIRENTLNEKSIVVYLVGTQNLEASNLRSFLVNKLPEYMIPSYFVQLDKFPITPNGKIDKKALPSPIEFSMDSGIEYIAPRNEIEEKLSRIWTELLENEKIGVKDHFTELGGNSLKVIRLQNAISKTFNVKIETNLLFNNQTIEEQASLISQEGKIKVEEIPPAPESAYYPLSSAQMRLWVMCHFESVTLLYNNSGEYLLEGELNTSILLESFKKLINRHESLRTNFKKAEDGQVYQFIRSFEELNFKIGYTDLRGNNEQDDQLREKIQAITDLEFNLESDLLLRVNIFQLEDQKWAFNCVIHHIVSDGWSIGVLIKEVLTDYNQLIQNKSVDLKPLRIHYKDYSVWEQTQIAEGKYEEHKTYWHNQFSDEIPVIELPTDRLRSSTKTYNGAVYSTSLTNKTVDKLREISKEQGSTLFMGLMAWVNVLLYKYTSQKDIVIGTSIAGRTHPDLENQIGFFVNTLAIRNRFEAEDTFSEVLDKVKNTTLNAYDHQSYPFDKLVDELNLVRDASHSALFDVMLILHDKSFVQINQELSGVSIQELELLERTTSKFDLTFEFEETVGGLDLSIEYNCDLFNEETIVGMTNHLDFLLQSICDKPNTSISNLQCLSPTDQHMILETFNDTKTTIIEATLIDLFELQVKNNPNNKALLFEDEEMTYGELQIKSNQLAAVLKETEGILPGDLVGLKAERSINLVISILALLKCGAGFVPIDSDYPEERINYIVSDSQCKKVYNNELLDQLVKTAKTFDVDFSSQAEVTQTVYVIYTSGTTGKPKGVSITNANLTNYLNWASCFYFTNSNEGNFGLYSSLSFDLTITSLFLPLIRGRFLKIFSEEMDIHEILMEYCESSELDTIKLTPSHVKILDNSGCVSTSLKKSIIGGEALLEKEIDILKSINPSIEVYNEYGPTEATIGCVAGKMEGQITIGKPIHNTSIYILDQDNKICPIGVTGELYIGGSGIAKGYLNNPELTQEKFITNPFDENSIIYKTGDLGKWLVDGRIVYFGRKDQQVKVRGHRIELEEIENNIRNYPSISNALVAVKEDSSGGKSIVAYYVSKDGIKEDDMNDFLAKTLPEFMLPNYYIELNEIPLTINGKVDVNALSLPSGDQSTSEYVAPSNEIEQKLATIWQEVLGKEKIGVRESFFDVGGDSIRAIKIVVRIIKEFNIKISMESLFKNPTIETLSNQLEISVMQNMDEESKENLNEIEL